MLSGMTDTKITNLMATLDVTRKGYESFFDRTMQMARALDLGVDDEELGLRVLEVMVVLEGLHAVSAFRPAVVEQNYEFKQRLLRRVNRIIRGE